MRQQAGLNLIIVLTLLGLTLMVSACGSEPETPTAAVTAPIPTSSEIDSGATIPVEETDSSTAGDLSEIVADRTPVPTPTAGPVAMVVEEIASESILADKSFLGLATEDWLNLGISILFVAIGYVLGVWLLFSLLKRVVRRTKTQFDDDFLAAIGPELKWLVAVFLTRYAVLRLDFWSDGQRTFLDDLIFILAFGIVYFIVLRLIEFAVIWYQHYLEPDDDKQRLDPLIIMLKRLGYIFASIVLLSFALSHFGINITVLSAAIIFAVLVIVIGAKAAVSDAISGFIILLDQPFRVGDTIFIKELDTRGDVLEIGTRTTRLRTRDNREVIVPNSQIGESQVVNYSYPDPRLRIQTDIGVDYGTDMDRVRQVIQQTVQSVEGVLHEKPVNVYFLTFGDSARQVRVRWWIDNYNNEKRMLDRVNAALERALDEAGIELPNTTYDLHLKMVGESGGPAKKTLSEASGGQTGNEM